MLLGWVKPYYRVSYRGGQYLFIGLLTFKTNIPLIMKHDNECKRSSVSIYIYKNEWLNNLIIIETYSVVIFATITAIYLLYLQYQGLFPVK